MKRIVLLILCVLLLGGCASTTKTNELDKIIEENNYILVDVRTKEEYDEGHLKDAINIPYDEINVDTELDKDKYILVYCKSGKRAQTAEAYLRRVGYDKVYNLGGFEQITQFEKISE